MASPKLAPTVTAGVLMVLPVISATICIQAGFLSLIHIFSTLALFCESVRAHM